MNVEFHPAALREVEEAQGWYEERSLFAARFPFTIYYRVRHNTLTVVAVAHQKRRPGYWTSR